MYILVEILQFLVKITWLWLVAIYKAVMPASLQPQKDVSGWLVLITGAGSGIGRLLALRFAGLGCRLVLFDLNQEGNEGTARLVKEARPGAVVKTYTIDLSNREQVYQVAKQVKADVGDVDILVNNAGMVTGKQFLDSPDTLNVKTMEVNVMAHFWMVKAFLPAMLQKDRGHLVTVASTAGFIGSPGLSDYCASKFGAIGFDESIRLEINKQKKKGVKTTLVCPAFMNTGMFEGFKYKFPAITPVLDPPYVADKIIDSVLIDQTMLCLPISMYQLYMLKAILPVSVTEALGEFMGLLNTMDDFKGRKQA